MAHATSLLCPQPKQFRKMIQQTFQQYALLREEECILKFLHTLSTFAHIDQESYRCELIVSARRGVHWGLFGPGGTAAAPMQSQWVRAASPGHHSGEGRGGFGENPLKMCILPLTHSQQGWNITVDLVIGPKGIRQMTSKEAKVGRHRGVKTLRGQVLGSDSTFACSPPAWPSSSTSNPSSAPAWRRDGLCCSWGSVAPPR